MSIFKLLRTGSLFLLGLAICSVVDAEWYEHSGVPSTGSQGSSAAMRAEFQSIETAFGLLPTYTGNDSEVVVVNATGTGLETVAQLPIAQGGTNAATASAARTNLGLAIGTDVQAYDADLQAISGLTSAADRGIYYTGSGTASLFTLTSAGRALLDDASASAQRTTLELGTAATATLTTSTTDTTGNRVLKREDFGIGVGSSDTGATWNDNMGGFVRNNTGSPVSFGAGFTAPGGRLQVAGRNNQVYTRDRGAGDTWYQMWHEGNLVKTANSTDTTSGSVLLVNHAEARYQPLDAGLTSIAGLTTAADRMIYTTASDTYGVATLTSAGRDLLDDADAATQLATLGLTATASEINTLDGITASTAELNILDGVTATASELNALDGITSTVTELNYTDGVTSAIQTQLDSKAATNANLSSFTNDLDASDFSAPSDTGHVGAVRTYIREDGGSSTSFAVVSNLVEDTWGSVGPTGSGADDTWAALDDIPSGARVAIVAFHCVGSRSASDTLQYSTTLYVRVTGSSATASASNYACRTDGIGGSAQTGVSNNLNTIDVPLDASGRFDIHWNEINTGSRSVFMYLKGYRI